MKKRLYTITMTLCLLWSCFWIGFWSNCFSVSAAEATNTPIEQLRLAAPYTYVVYGNYEQDNVIKNGKEPIEWIVLENTGDSLLLMSRYVLDGVPYSNAYLNGNTWEALPVTWETCNLRFWLNTDFLMTAFSPEEQLRIMTVCNQNTPSEVAELANWKTTDENGNLVPVVNTNHGNDTNDRVFLLSTDEVKKYFPLTYQYLDNEEKPRDYNPLLKLQATNYATKHGVDVWTTKDTQLCLSNGGGFMSIAQSCEGFAEKVVLRTLDSRGKNVVAYNIGANGVPYGVRTVTYDFGECPVIRLNVQ